MVDAIRTTTLEKLRSRVADRLGDLHQVEATAVGSVSTFTDVINIPIGNRLLTKQQMVFTSGALRGQIVVITDTNQGTNSITFAPPQASAPQIGDTADIVNSLGMGYTFKAIDRAINQVIDESYPLARTQVLSADIAFSAASPTITVPTTMEEVYAIEWYDTGREQWVEVYPAKHRGHRGWQPEIWDGEITIDPYIAGVLDGSNVRILGEGRHAQLSLYSDATSLHPDYIVAQACYYLTMSGLKNDQDGSRSRTVLQFAQEAELKKTQIRTRRQSRSVAVRQ